MNGVPSSNGLDTKALHRLYDWLVPRAASAIVMAALVCTLAVKLFHAIRYGMVHAYPAWVLADLGALLVVEAVLAMVLFVQPRLWVFRMATVIAALICTWSVVNAGWLIRTGTQILPSSVAPLGRDPLNTLGIVGMNLAKNPIAAVALLGPSALALLFFFSVLVRPVLVSPNRRALILRAGFSVMMAVAALVWAAWIVRRPSSTAFAGLYYNCQLKAITSLILPDTSPIKREDFLNTRRTIPSADQVHLAQSVSGPRYNLVLVVLEGIQYRYTSLADPQANPTPFLRSMADQGASFTRMRSVLTHTTKALFSLLTGLYPSASHDVVEAVPTRRPYASLATILKGQLGYRTAFFQSAKGNFESRPALVSNLGFETFWARDNLKDPNAYLGYLASDEFSMLDPIRKWIAADPRPFFVTVLCSVTHDPYVVPRWFVTPAKDPLDRYRQAVRYTDSFLRSLDMQISNLGLSGDTVVCVVGDHGEAFGEHGKLGHDLIGFEEVLRIPWVIRAPGMVTAGLRIKADVSSVDVMPTMLALLGFEPNTAGFDGVNALGPIPGDRKVFFSDWVSDGPAGFVFQERKYLHTPSINEAAIYDLVQDPCELACLTVSDYQAEYIARTLVDWRRGTLIRPDQEDHGRQVLFSRWVCRWFGRDPITRPLQSQ